MTHLVRVGDRLRRHDEGVYNARPDGEPDETAMLGGVASGIYQEDTQDGIYPANHLQVIPAFAPVPHPPRRPNQPEGVYEQEDYAEYNERGFEKRLAGAIAHLVALDVRLKNQDMTFALPLGNRAISRMLTDLSADFVFGKIQRLELRQSAQGGALG